jgi:hypothetical protein
VGRENEVITTITDLGQAILASISNAIFVMIAAVPHIVAFLLVLIVGWLLAAAIGGVVASLLRTIKFNDLAQRSGISGFVQKMGIQTDASGAVAAGVRWFIRLIALVVAFDALGLPAVSQMLQAFLLWLPNLLVAVAVLVIAGLLANALGDLVRGSTAQAGLGNRFGVVGGDLAGFPNGRRLEDDVTDIELRAVAGVLDPKFAISPNKDLGDGVDANEVAYKTSFPYVATAWGGFEATPNGAAPSAPSAAPAPPAGNPGMPTTGSPLVNHLADIYGLLVAALLLVGAALFGGGWMLARRKAN